MCGLTGFWDPRVDRFEPIIFAMTNALRHRGPDGAGYWCDGRNGVALGHRRLSIIDLSDRGRQPMFSASGRYALVYNGEVYNFEALRHEILRLHGGEYPFVGGSDTEVILAAVEQWGLDDALRRMVGMFAFALWDREEKTLSLVRDHMGIKPLYYASVGGAFVFGSELKALAAFPALQPQVSRDALMQFLRYSSVPAPATIYEGVKKVCPGEIVEVVEPVGGSSEAVQCRRWWQASEVVKEGRDYPFVGDADQATDVLEKTLEKAVGDRMVADVPLGSFLSGGIDSSTIVALMQKQSMRPVKTFSIGMANERYDEAGDAERVARHLGTDHTGLIIKPEDVMEVIPKMATLYDEPFADSSQLPTFLVSQLAREEVTVALSGDGGDELFGGYNRHLWGPRIWEGMRWISPRLRGALARGATSVSPAGWDEFFGSIDGVLPSALRVRMAGDKMHKMAKVLEARDQEELYRMLTSQWKDPARVVLGGVDGPREYGEMPESLTMSEQWMYRDMVGYLPDDILTKVDRASMGVALEARVPFLDRRVVSLAWRLPMELKIRDGQGKWLLRQVLYRHVPRELVERPKMGFGIPVDAWLRGALRSWARGLLEPYRLEREGFFDPAPVTRMWEEHQSERRNWAYPLWNVLVFQQWWASVGGGADEREDDRGLGRVLV